MTTYIPAESDTPHVHAVLDGAESIAPPNDSSDPSKIRTTEQTCDGTGRVKDDILDGESC